MSAKHTKNWYVATAFFAHGGKIVRARSGQLLGPWKTREEALACRYGLEQSTGTEGNYFIDHT